jgi:hypothetical protein
MKKILLLVFLLAGTIGAFAQTERGEKSILFSAGLKSDPSRFFVGAQGRYNILNNVRVAPDIYFVLPKDKVTGLDVDINFHYVFDLDNSLTIYPLAGISMSNNRYAGNNEVSSSSSTNWGFNLGGGLSYNLTDFSYVNLEAKYTFSDFDFYFVGIGYGFRF